MNGVRGAELLLVLAVLASALSVSWSVHRARTLTAALQQAHTEHDRLQTEWGQLLLEHSTWGSYARVERVAREKLHMKLPDTGEKVMVTP